MTVDEMQYGFMPERITIDAVFILRRLQEEYHAVGKNVAYLFCGSRESSSQSTVESLGMGIEEERNTRRYC